MNKKIWSAPIALIVVLVSALIFGGITVSADTVAEGECGTNATWTLDSDGTLTISGTGDMDNFGYQSAPWFSTSTVIKKIVVGDGITYIGQNSFSSLESVTSVTIGSGVKSIGDYAFKYNTSLTSVYIPAGVETMGYGVFGDCSVLTTVTFAEHSVLTEIPYECFSYCYKLSLVNIPSNVTTIGGYAFNDCYELTDLTVPANVTKIGQSAYRNCDGLTSVTLSEGVTTIGSYAFAYCDSLTTVDFPDTLTSIEYYAFYDSALTSVVLPDSAVSIGEQAFAYCDALKTASITLDENSQTSGAFAWCTNLETVTIKGNPKSLGYNTFNSCVNLTSVTIPDSIEEIYSYTFRNCSSLENITLPSGLKEISSNCFADCTNLKSIVLPDTLEVIGNYAFSNSGLVSVTIPAKVVLGEDAFSGCEKLQSVTFAEGITSIPNYAFVGCTSLKTVNIPDTVTYIGISAFTESSIESVVIPGSVKEIGDYAFYGCYNLSSATIGKGVETIGEQAFFECKKLESIAIPGTVKIVKPSLFSNCYNLRYLELGEGIEEIHKEAFSNCSSLETIILPSTIVDIRYQAFYGCTNVNDIYCDALVGFNWDDYRDDFKDPGLKSTFCHVGEGLADDFAEWYPNVNVTFVDGTISDARITGHSITLSADIGVNFFIRLPKGYDSNNTEVTFTWGYGDRAHTAKGKLVAINQYGANYKVTCGVASCEMVDEITMVVKAGNEELITDTYSVVQYINVLSNPDDYEDLQNLLAAMVFYGYYSQLYFEYRTDNLVNDQTNTDYFYNSAIWNYLFSLENDYPDPAFLTIMGIDSDELGIKYYGASVLCGSQNKVRFYFEIKDPAKINSLTASYKSQGLTFKTRTVNGVKLVYIETPGLAAGEIEQPITVTINGSTYTYDFRFYIQQCIAKKYEQGFAETACSLYALSHFARIYQEGSSNG
ncbi:MAG: leucine-rich repeat protein [Clostridiales bacterium]|nr:leucine-rich repeat protein [Clostridiales bacterium]